MKTSIEVAKLAHNYYLARKTCRISKLKNTVEKNTSSKHQMWEHQIFF